MLSGFVGDSDLGCATVVLGVVGRPGGFRRFGRQAGAEIGPFVPERGLENR